MNPVTVFGPGTQEGRAAALGQFEAAQGALARGEEVRWLIDPGNLGLLSRALGEPAARGPGRITGLLAAIDESPSVTRVAQETKLIPTLIRLGQAALTLRMTNGRPYFLPPPALDISTGNLCGLACVMCDNRASGKDPLTLTPAEVRGLLAQAAEWGIRKVSLTGAGEPFRDPEMLGHIRAANQLGQSVAVTSNGTPITPALAAELADQGASVSVSIHGSTPAAHEAIVGVKGIGERAFQAVQRLVSARDALAGRSKLSVHVSAVIQRANLQEIAPLARWAQTAGCNGFNVQPINLQHGTLTQGPAIHGTIIRRDDRLRMDSLWPTAAQSDALDRLIDDLRQLGAATPQFLHASPERLTLLRQYFKDSSREALGVSCRVGESFLGVDHRGTIKPCYRVPWRHGDARRVNLRFLWNSQSYAHTRAAIARCPLTCLNNCFFREGKRE